MAPLSSAWLPGAPAPLADASLGQCQESQHHQQDAVPRPARHDASQRVHGRQSVGYIRLRRRRHPAACGIRSCRLIGFASAWTCTATSGRGPRRGPNEGGRRGGGAERQPRKHPPPTRSGSSVQCDGCDAASSAPPLTPLLPPPPNPRRRRHRPNLRPEADRTTPTVVSRRPWRGVSHAPSCGAAARRART